MIIRAYLRASTSEQDATRAKGELQGFIEPKGLVIGAWYQENVSGTTIERPELSRLLNDSNPGDVLLIEKLDRLSRLPWESWQDLKAKIASAGVHIVVLDQPMTHGVLTGTGGAETMIQKALTSFMLDLAASMARDDYETRRKRQAQGIEKAKSEGKYQGRKADDAKYRAAALLFESGLTGYQVWKLGTVYKSKSQCYAAYKKWRN